METQVRTPQAIFSQPQRFLVPLFQRPYVWSEEQQWEPLWRDLERVAQRLLMPLAGPRSVRRYSDEFKLTAVRLSQQLGIQVKTVAAALEDPSLV